MKLYQRNSRPISFFFSQATPWVKSYLLRKNEKLLSCVAGISVDLLRIGRVELLASSHTCAMCGCCQRRRVASAHLVHEDDHTISRCKPYKQVYNTFHPYNRDTITLLTNYAGWPSMVVIDALTTWSFLIRSSDTSGYQRGALQRTQPVKNRYKTRIILLSRVQN